MWHMVSVQFCNVWLIYSLKLVIAILYLASREARWITGVILPVDAGTTAGSSNRPALSEDKPLVSPPS